MNLVLLLAVLTFLFWLRATWIVRRGNRRMRRLATLDAPVPATWPRVSIVFAARNEAATVGAAVPTMLRLDYPGLEVIAVDDRSEDDTGAILDRLAAENETATAGPRARLRVAHVRGPLPAGWIGKTHALHAGARLAAGEWILFTDADVHFAPEALRRAVACAVAGRIDLLAAVPQLSEHGHLLGICVNAFSFTYTLGIKPWRIPDPRSCAHGSVGAFGLVRAARYREFGGHEPIRLRPDDDIKLGKLFKTRGARCELVQGVGAISVAWYESMPQMVRGLTKNAYAAADYRPWVPLVAALGLVTSLFWPMAAIGAADGTARWLNAGSVALVLWLGCDQTRFTGGRWWHGLFLPVGLAVFSFTLIRSMVVTHWTRGITWRGTHYPLRELRANRV